MENVIVGKSLVIEGEITELINSISTQTYRLCIKTKEGVLVSFGVAKDIIHDKIKNIQMSSNGKIEIMCLPNDTNLNFSEKEETIFDFLQYSVDIHSVSTISYVNTNRETFRIEGPKSELIKFFNPISNRIILKEIQFREEGIGNSIYSKISLFNKPTIVGTLTYHGIYNKQLLEVTKNNELWQFPSAYDMAETEKGRELQAGDYWIIDKQMIIIDKNTFKSDVLFFTDDDYTIGEGDMLVYKGCGIWTVIHTKN